MRIPSLRKLERQVEAWLQQNFFAPELEAQIREAEALVRELRGPWLKKREGFCNGQPCVCSTHPEYDALVTKTLLPVVHKVDELHMQRRKLMAAARAAKFRELISDRHARLAYKNRRTRKPK